MATEQISKFSEDGEYLAHSSSDGTLRIFETATGILRQEYSSASHLSATTSALTWSRQKRESLMSPKSKRKKLNKYLEVHDDGLKLIALGTTAGTVNLYSFAKGTLHTQLSGGHSSKVNDACWDFSGLELFTCSDDQYVVQWNLRKGIVKHKWKCDSSGVHAVCQCSATSILTASHTIKMWDLDTKALLKTFTGHSSPVFWLMPVVPEEDGTHYVLSAALDDRHINVWRCDGSSSKDQNSIASFSVPDEPVSVSLSRPSSSTQALMLSVITRKGVVHLFEQTLNGRKKKPLVSKMTVTAAVTTKDSEEETDDASRVPIFASVAKPGSISVALGNPMQPQFEQVAYDSSRSEVVIPVQPPKKTLNREEFSQVKRPEIPNHTTTLVPADAVPMQASKKPDKKRLRKSSVSDLTVEERLNAMGTDVPTTDPVKQPPVANTLSRLLQQGLLSGDKKILNGVFNETNQTVIHNTIRRLPLACIVPLVKEIEKGMSGHSQLACNLNRWISALLSCHTSYILSVPEIVSTMSKLHQAMVPRQKFFPKILQLKGRLELMKEKVVPQESDEDPDVAPLSVYQDESDSDGSDSMVIDGAAEESDENWEELSDMD